MRAAALTVAAWALVAAPAYADGMAAPAQPKPAAERLDVRGDALRLAPVGVGRRRGPGPQLHRRAEPVAGAGKPEDGLHGLHAGQERPADPLQRHHLRRCRLVRVARALQDFLAARQCHRRRRVERGLPLLDGRGRRHVRGAALELRRERRPHPTPSSRCSRAAATGTRSSTSTSALSARSTSTGSSWRAASPSPSPAPCSGSTRSSARACAMPRRRARSSSLRGDIGGFGAASKLTWQALATYNWLLCVHGPLTIDGYVGYRALSVDYERARARAATSSTCCSTAPSSG